MAGEQSDPTNEQIAQVLAEHGRKAAVWDHFNLVILTDGKKKAQCKGCGVLLTAQGNSTLRRHRDHSCPSLRANTGPNQPILDNDGQVWM